MVYSFGVMKKNLIHVIYPDEATYSYVVTNDMSVTDNLERVFAEWNHGSGMECEMFIKSNKRSLSVNDIVCVNTKYFQCQSVGWNKVTDEYVYQLEQDVANSHRRSEGAWFALSDVMYSRTPDGVEVTLDGIDVL
jgi:hypothetical protein